MRGGETKAELGSGSELIGVMNAILAVANSCDTAMWLGGGSWGSTIALSADVEESSASLKRLEETRYSTKDICSV